MLAGMMARPAATSARTNSGVISSGMRGAEGFAGVLVVMRESGGARRAVCRDRCGDVLRSSAICARPHVFADGDEFHLGRDDALARIPELRDGMAGAERAERLAFRAGEMLEAIPALGLAGEFCVAAREVAVVLRFDLAAFVLGDVPSPRGSISRAGPEGLCLSRQ